MVTLSSLDTYIWLVYMDKANSKRTNLKTTRVTMMLDHVLNYTNTIQGSIADTVEEGLCDRL